MIANLARSPGIYPALLPPLWQADPSTIAAADPVSRLQRDIPAYSRCSESVFNQARTLPFGMDFFEQACNRGPTWDTGRPQREFVALEEAGAIAGDVLDVGCGTGENALFLAGRGHDVWGVDSAPRAIGIARGKAEERGRAVTFLVLDALDLHGLGRTFDTVINSGLFHALLHPERSGLSGASPES